MKTQLNLLIIALTLFSGNLFSQNVIGISDTICIEIGETINYNIYSNDILGGPYAITDVTPFLFPNETCFYIEDPSGDIKQNPDEDCPCGEYELAYELVDLDANLFTEPHVYITVKCPELDCESLEPNCFSNEINFSTGYDPLAGTLLPPSSSGISGASQDPNWILVNAPTNNGPVNLNAPAFVIPTNPSWDDMPLPFISGYLSAFQNSTNNNSNAGSTDQAYVFEREFCVCEEDIEILIDGKIHVDNYLKLSLVGPNLPPAGLLLANINTYSANNFTNPPENIISTVANLSSGTYKLVAELRNDNPGSPMGFNIYGTITSSSSGLVTSQCCNKGSYLSGYKYIDNNCDGVFNQNDAVSPNWTINLSDALGNPMQTTTTDINGFYSFNVPSSGSYIISEVQQNNSVQSSPGGSLTHPVTIVSGPIALSGYNFGNCVCESIDVVADPLIMSNGEPNDCCASLSYTNNGINLQGMVIRSSDADLDFDLTTLDPGLGVFSTSPNSLTLTSNLSGNSIPTGINNFVEMCIGEVFNDPQLVIVDWYDFDNEIVCSDTLTFNCPIEPDCLYLESDSIYCDMGQVFYDMTICNPHTNQYAVTYVSFDILSPASVIITPSALNIPPLAPGACYTTTIQLNGTGIAGDLFCYTLTAHDANPAEVDTVLCCSTQEEYCKEIPICDPCAFVGIENVNSVDSSDCCYQIDLFNNFDPNYFDEIAMCVISPSTTISSVNNTFGSPWTTSLTSSTTLSFYPTLGTVPLGINSLPEVCFNSNIAPSQQVEIKWINQGEVVCRDTVSIDCLPDCGYFTEDDVVCSPFVPNLWNFTGTLFNNTPYQVDDVVISSSNPAVIGMSFPITIAPYTTYSTINFDIGSPAQAGDTICFYVSMKSLSADGNYIECCHFEHCVVLPECGGGGEPNCVCDEEFYEHVNNGISCSQSGTNPLSYGFSLTDAAYFGDCDEIYWYFGDGSIPIPGNFTSSIIHTYPSFGAYNVCATILRTGETEECKTQVCKKIILEETPIMFDIHPNPGRDFFIITPLEGEFINTVLTVTNLYGEHIASEVIENAQKNVGITLDLTSITPGIYLVTIVADKKSTTKRLIKL